MLIKMGFARRGATLVIAVDAQRRQNSLVTIATMAAAEDGAGRAGRKTCL
jgi:hypothetical protein